jgi:hypothetical protein
MRAHVDTFLSDVGARSDSPEAGVAHRTAGITHWFAGEYVGALEPLERTLALFQPGRDDDLAFRFGHDAGVATMLYLALVLWSQGDIGRAVSLFCDAEARVARHPHIGADPGSPDLAAGALAELLQVLERLPPVPVEFGEAVAQIVVQLGPPCL